MALRSRTGLLESVKKTIKKPREVPRIEFPNISCPAPYVLRPFAGVYNPFPYGCSILCNHPADTEAKDVVKRAKSSWANDGKALLLPEELDAIRASLQGVAPYEDGEDAVPEELFRRYTDTDSRPLTPAPTMVSGGTRSSARRCVTPDVTRERTLLVLDLRRSHSQETLTCLGHAAPSTRTPTPSVQVRKKRILPRKKIGTTPKPECEAEQIAQKTKLEVLSSIPQLSTETLIPTDTGVSEDEDAPKRRGKRQKSKKSGPAGQKVPDKGFQGIPDPGETQISTLGDECQNLSRKTSATGVRGSGPTSPVIKVELPISSTHKYGLSGQSFIDSAILRQLQRELDQEVIDSVFEPIRKRALEEAIKCLPREKRLDGWEMKMLKTELQAPVIIDDERWLRLPRTFTRQSSRFELPLDTRQLNTMTPLEYARNHVSVSSGRLQLYNQVYNRHRVRDELEEEEEIARKLSGQIVVTALGEVMGQPLSDSQAKYFHELIGWNESDYFDFQTWCGLCALSERLLAAQFMASPSRVDDPCHEVEQADFETLNMKLQRVNPDARLKTILIGIRES